MSFTTAVVILLAVLSAIQVVITYGIIRRLRSGAATATELHATVRPLPGWIVDLTADADSEWPEDAAELTRGDCIAAVILHGCPACLQFRRDLTRLENLGMRLYIIAERSAFTSEEMAEWPNVTRWFVLPSAAEDLAAFDYPDALPSLMVLREGVVVSSGYRLSEIEPAMARLAEHPVPSIAN